MPAVAARLQKMNVFSKVSDLTLDPWKIVSINSKKDPKLTVLQATRSVKLGYTPVGQCRPFFICN